MYDESSHIDCLRLLEETGDYATCIAAYPEMRGPLEALQRLQTSQPNSVLSSREAKSRRSLLSVTAELRKPQHGSWFRLPTRTLSIFAALGLLAAGSIGAGAAVGVNDPGALNDVLSAIGAVEQADPENHGAAVSDAVHEAKQDLAEGESKGEAVSRAACEAAHDRSTLPEGAQNAPGQQDREPKDCDKGDSDEEESEESTLESQQAAPGEKEKDRVKPSQAPVGPGTSNAGGNGNGNLEPGNPNPGGNGAGNPNAGGNANPNAGGSANPNAGGANSINGDSNSGNSGSNGSKPNPANPNPPRSGNGGKP